MKRDAGLLVPIRVELNAPLLHPHAKKMLRGIKRVSEKITFHGLLAFYLFVLNVFCRFVGGILRNQLAGEGAGEEGRRELGHLPACLRQPQL
jgi:hypothetical protein